MNANFDGSGVILDASQAASRLLRDVARTDGAAVLRERAGRAAAATAGTRPAHGSEGRANPRYPACLPAVVSRAGDDAVPIPALLVDLSAGGAGVEVQGDFAAPGFWLRFEWEEWECCFECREIARVPILQNTFVQAAFVHVSEDEREFLGGILADLRDQFITAQRRLAKTQDRRVPALRAKIAEGSYQPNPRNVAWRILNPGTQAGGFIQGWAGRW